MASFTAKLPHIDPIQEGRSLPYSPSSPKPFNLSGPTYAVPGYPSRFKLPPPTILKPGVERPSGNIDRWPVHHDKKTPSAISTNNNEQPPQTSSSLHPSPGKTKARTTFSPGKLCPSATERPSITPKPKFLDRLEKYLYRELRLLGCPPTGPHELRLQAHREVFEYLIQDFKTYKPLLSAIKNEYELYLSYLEDIIRELRPIRGHLAIVKDECERKMMTMKEQEKQGEAEVSKENKRLQEVIKLKKRDEQSYQSQIKKLQSEVGKLYRQYRDESDARKVLLAEYNDLKYKHQEQKGDEVGTTAEAEDPVVLKLKLIRAREDLKLSNQRINTILADYGDVVPRKEYESMETSCVNLQTELDNVKADTAAFMQEHSALQGVYKQVQTERDKLAEDLEKLQRSATPRPDWDRCTMYVEGGASRWEELAEGRSSDGKLDILLSQLAGIPESELARGEPFMGQGKGDDVPRYLRVDQSTEVKNRRISERELNLLLKGFWQHRLSSTQQPPLPLDEEVYVYLYSRHADAGDKAESLAIEDGYNLHEALLRYNYQRHVSLFQAIMEGTYKELVFKNWVHMQKELAQAFSQHQVKQGFVSVEVFVKVVESVLKSKPADHVQQLYHQAIKHCADTPGFINFDSLLSPSEDGCPSEFCSMLLGQLLSESQSFMSRLQEELEGKESISLEESVELLQSVGEESRSYESIIDILATAFSLNAEDIYVEAGSRLRDVTIATAVLLKQLERMGAH